MPVEFWIMLWLIAGFLDYGLTKGWNRDIRDGYEEGWPDWDWKQELNSLISFVVGPVGLITMIPIRLATKGKISWCLKMPERHWRR